NDPVPVSFVDLPAAGRTGNAFTIETNSATNTVSPTTTNPLMITNLKAERSVLDAANGVYLWTVTFNVSANASFSVRSATISVPIGGVSKTVTVSQVAAAVYVNEPQPASFVDLPADGKTGNAFTIETNLATKSVSPTIGGTTPSIVAYLGTSRSVLDVMNGVYLWTVTFGVTANTSASVRSANISISIDGISKTVTFSQLGHPLSMHDGMANCYMVAPGGNVSFKVSQAYRYDGSASFTNTLHTTGGEYTGAFGVEIVWQDVTNLVTPSIVSGTGKDTRVNIQVNGSTPGNAVVKIYKAGDTSKIPVWSYHIWVTDYTGSATWTNPYQTVHTYTFMDRNLGATEAALSLAGRGLFYQWGRKDPFPGGKEGTAGYAALSKFYGINQDGAAGTTAVRVSSSTNAGAIVESIQDPTTFFEYKNSIYNDWLPVKDDNLWSTNGMASGNKTIYDPCPAGWRVPANVVINDSDDYSPWMGVPAPPRWAYGSDAGGANWGTNALFPAAGRRFDNNGSIGYEGFYGVYWSASPHWRASPFSSSSNYASSLYFLSGNVNVDSYNYRAYGFSVRCAQE
ncbi:MAG: hypothetical protein LBG18_04135, partial [Mediterranea sp.]|nr:hypothetical protein [Mediterranea sp.]